MQKQIKKAQLVAFMLIVTLIAMGTASAADSLSDNSVTCVNHSSITHDVQKTVNVAKKTKNLSINKIKSSNTPVYLRICKDGVLVSKGGRPAGYKWGTIQNVSNTVTESQYTHNSKLKSKTAILKTRKAAQVTMTETSNSPVITVGQKGIFTVTVTNNGPDKAKNIKVLDPYLPGFNFTVSKGKYNLFTGIWDIGTLANGKTATLTMTRIMEQSDLGKTYFSTASETQDTYNPNPVTPKTATLTVKPVAHVTMTKTSNGPLYVGDRGIFTITLTNNGPCDAANVQVNDPFISGFTYSSSVGTYDAEKGVWNV